MWRWENWTSTGVERDSGVGLMVTEITLELRTVLFLTRKHRNIDSTKGYLELTVKALLITLDGCMESRLCH